MSGVLVDTSFFAALLSPRDALHQRAVELSQQAWDERVTTEFILLELANFLAKSSVRNLLPDLVQRLYDDPATTIVPCTTERFQRGLVLYASRPDKQWSLTDCISFQVMTERGLSEALTYDRHFEQTGFKALMR
ncbi:MAG: PIN domain-containing protein [Planctomycetaceae bacterium]|nr:PIN domain-containing protein [Planctomycetaceae bacterium]